MIQSDRIALLASAASLSLFLSAPAALAQDSANAGGDIVLSLRAEISQLDADIAAARQAEETYSGGALGAISALNTKTLELTQSALEARLAAEQGGAAIEIVVPAVQPDPNLAEEIAREMEAQQNLVDTAQAEARSAGGLMAALAFTRYETERMTLAQLRQAWLQARFGIAFPMTTAPDAPPAKEEAAQDAADDTPAATQDWADPEHPDIDYSAAVFSQLDGEDFEIFGWWGMQRSAAAIDDTPQVFAMNVSDWGTGYTVTNPSLNAACIEGEARVIFNADDYLLTDVRTYTMPVTVRIDEAEAQQMTWSGLTSNTGAGLFGEKAEQFMRDLHDADRVFMRLRERNNETHDLEIDLAGARKVFSAIAEACQFSLLHLSRDDYRAIQSLLNAGGFEAGTPDGIWGQGSRAAMSNYQAANRIEQTGVPDEPTLAKMGLDVSQ